MAQALRLVCFAVSQYAKWARRTDLIARGATLVGASAPHRFVRGPTYRGGPVELGHFLEYSCATFGLGRDVKVFVGAMAAPQRANTVRYN